MAETPTLIDPVPAPVESPPAAPVAGKNGTELVHKLKTPLASGGKTFESLNLDFDKLKARGFKAVAVQFRALVKEFVAIPWTDERYQLMCVARLNGLIYEDLDELGGADTVAVMGAARNFFVEQEKS
jgi:hypothetical protein